MNMPSRSTSGCPGGLCSVERKTKRQPSEYFHCLTCGYDAREETQAAEKLRTDPNHKHNMIWASDGWFCETCGTDASEEENKVLSAPYETP